MTNSTIKLQAALQAAKRAINSMKVEAETAAQGDEQMMLEACEQISNEGLAASMAIDAVIGAGGVERLRSPAEPAKTPQAGGADWFIVIDPGPDGDGAVFAYDADLGREFGHDHIKDAQDRENPRAAHWVVRPAYADCAARAQAPAAVEPAAENIREIVAAIGAANMRLVKTADGYRVEKATQAYAAQAAPTTKTKPAPIEMNDALRKFIEGMSVSVDVSTGDHDAYHRYFGKVTEVMDCHEDKHGVILLVQEPEPNFKAEPAEKPTRDGWEKAQAKAYLAICEVLESAEFGTLSRAPSDWQRRDICDALRDLLAKKAAPADALDTKRLDFVERSRVALVPEFEGPWEALVYEDDAEPVVKGEGNTPRAAIDAAIAAQAPTKGDA